ncbi:hypothetical protein IAR50_000029 [Cryptococcus sp. DSM 104548]
MEQGPQSETDGEDFSGPVHLERGDGREEEGLDGSEYEKDEEGVDVEEDDDAVIVDPSEWEEGTSDTRRTWRRLWKTRRALALHFEDGYLLVTFIISFNDLLIGSV